jgi:hypothetical protein
MSQLQWVVVPVPANQPSQAGQQTTIGTFTLFLWNAGKASAREVLVGHFGQPPPHSVYPDLPRNTVNTPGGGAVVRFQTIPARTLVSITYLLWGVQVRQQTISYVTSESGQAKTIPVMLQRIWPKWYTTLCVVLFFVGMWVVLNALISLIGFLWVTYYGK